MKKVFFILLLIGLDGLILWIYFLPTIANEKLEISPFYALVRFACVILIAANMAIIWQYFFSRERDIAAAESIARYGRSQRQQKPIKKLHFVFLFSLFFYLSLLWEGFPPPDISLEKRHFSSGRYYCPKTGGGGRSHQRTLVDDIEYYEDWGRVLGVYHKIFSCINSMHGSFVDVEWVDINGKRLLISLKKRDGEIVGFYKKRESYLKEKIESKISLYIAKTVLFIALIFLTNNYFRKRRNDTANGRD